MKKNEYVSPKMEIIEVKMQNILLAGSDTETGGEKGGDDDL